MKKGDIKFLKINGKVNPADFLTTPKSAKETASLAEALNYDMNPRTSNQEEAGSVVMEVARWIEEAARSREKTKARM